MGDTGKATTIVVMEGDQTGQELLEEALRVLGVDVTGVPLDLARFDLSLGHRRATRNKIVYEAAAALCEARLGLKAATITPEGLGDVGSPNAILRKEVDGQVIVRTGRRIPGVRPIGGVYSPITVVRMAVDDAYGAREWREVPAGQGDDEWAYRTEKISRRTCRAVAEYAFLRASQAHAKVFGGPKYTVSPIYEGMLKEEMDAAAGRYPQVRYEPQLIDATYALLLSSAGDPMVIPALNRDGDLLSDLVLQMFGSIAGAESLLLSFDAAVPAQRGDGRGPPRHRTLAPGQKRRQPDGHDPGFGFFAWLRTRLTGPPGRPRHQRGRLRGRLRRHPHRRSGRPRHHHRVHQRGHPPGAYQAGDLGRSRGMTGERRIYLTSVTLPVIIATQSRLIPYERNHNIYLIRMLNHRREPLSGERLGSTPSEEETFWALYCSIPMTPAGPRLNSQCRRYLRQMIICPPTSVWLRKHAWGRPERNKHSLFYNLLRPSIQPCL